MSRGKIMNTAGAVTSSSGSYMYIRLYIYIMLLLQLLLYYARNVYIYFEGTRVKGASQDHKNNILITQAPNNIAQNIPDIHTILKMCCFQQTQHMNAVGRRTFVSG